MTATRAMIPPSDLPTEAALVEQSEGFLHQGEPLLAYNVADTGLQRWPGHVRLRQLQALALARTGDIERARDPALRAKHLEAAFRLYERAYASSRQRGVAAGAYYTGINAATVAVLRGELEEARWIAAEVADVCNAVVGVAADPATEYWRQATLGEAALILGDAPLAAQHYAAAMALAQGRYGDLSTTRRQSRLLAQHLPVDDEWLDEALSIPPVLVFTGHMVDQAGRETSRFPAALEGAVQPAIREAIAAMRPLASIQTCSRPRTSK